MIAATGLGISSVSINATISTRQKIAWGAWLCAGDASLTSSGKFSATKSRPCLVQHTDQFPVTHNQDDIAQQQRLIRQRTFQRHAIAL